MTSLPGLTGVIRSPDGVDLAVHSWEGEQPGALFVHATGFCKETWAPVVEEMAGGWRGTAMDQRGHGDSGAPVGAVSWESNGRDVATVAAEAEPPILGIGHSGGATALAMAEIARPGTFAGLLLIEPIVFPGPYVRFEDEPLAVLARKRRRSFASRDEALANFKDKGPFPRWDRRALDEYVSGCMTAVDGEWRLKCDPETEAELFRVGRAHDTWEHLDRITVPVTIVAGAESDTHTGPVVAALTERFADAVATIVSGTTHFVPMERPDLIAAEAAALWRRCRFG